MSAADDKGTALAVTAIHKAYGACVALAGATLAVARGTIHAVVGENGAGKSTLLRIAYGLDRADQGTIAIGGAIDPARHAPRLARARGLGFVQQHGALVPSLTVAENAALLLGHGAFVDVRGPAAALTARGLALGLAVDPHARVADLPVGVAQRAEILIALCGGATILALDEPTALLTPAEIDALLAALRRLREGGATVILVTHKLDEVRAVADAITVLRAGRTVATFAGDAPTAAIVEAMVGATIVAATAPPRPPAAAPVLALRDVTLGRCGRCRWRSRPARSSASRASTATASASWSRRSPGSRAPPARSRAAAPRSAPRWRRGARPGWR